MNIKFLGPDGEDSFEVGDTIRLESTVESEPEFSDTKTKENVTTAEITITDFDGTEKVSQASMTNHDTGEYFYMWDTTGLSSGDYKVKIDVEESGVDENDVEYIRLNPN